jgi:hypothetical protein
MREEFGRAAALPGGTFSFSLPVPCTVSNHGNVIAGSGPVHCTSEGFTTMVKEFITATRPADTTIGRLIGVDAVRCDFRLAARPSFAAYNLGLQKLLHQLQPSAAMLPCCQHRLTASTALTLQHTDTAALTLLLLLPCCCQDMLLLHASTVLLAAALRCP